MGVVRDGYAHRAALEAITLQKSLADVARMLMAFDYRHLEDVRSDYVDVAVLGIYVHYLATRNNVAGENGHDSSLSALQLKSEVVRLKLVDVHGVEHALGKISPGRIEERLAVLGYELAVLEHVLCIEVFEIVDDDEVGDLHGSYRALVLQ